MKDVSDPVALGIGEVALIVSDLRRAASFYQEVLGFELNSTDEFSSKLGLGEQDLLILRESPDAERHQGTAGLYHFAVLYPTRKDLASALSWVLKNGVLIDGFADHHVSEAVYLRDPDGNGIELYRDRPRESWRFEHGELVMGTAPLDVSDLLTEAQTDRLRHGLPLGTRIGHVHLHVSELESSEAFYRGILGFDLMMHYGDSASFLSSGGYHHHIGINTWMGRGAPGAVPGSLGMDYFRVEYPTQNALATVVARLGEAVVEPGPTDGEFFTTDPSGNRILLSLSPGG